MRFDQTGVLHQVLARKIRILRVSRGWSQEVLAELCGLHRNYIGYVERAQVNIGLTNLEKIARAFGLPAYALLKDESLSLLKEWHRVEEDAAAYELAWI